MVLRARMGGAVVPVQILAIGGAAMLVFEAVSVTLLANGRARAVMWWGWGHFIVYGAAVLAVTRFGLNAIAAAAAVVHTAFLIIAYIQLNHGERPPSVQDARQGCSSRGSLLVRARRPRAAGQRLRVEARRPDAPVSAYDRLCRRRGLFPQHAHLVPERAATPRSPRKATAARARPSPVRSVRPVAASISWLGQDEITKALRWPQGDLAFVDRRASPRRCLSWRPSPRRSTLLSREGRPNATGRLESHAAHEDRRCGRPTEAVGIPIAVFVDRLRRHSWIGRAGLREHGCLWVPVAG